jgi:hypothetical protein
VEDAYARSDEYAILVEAASSVVHVIVPPALVTVDATEEIAGDVLSTVKETLLEVA